MTVFPKFGALAIFAGCFVIFTLVVGWALRTRGRVFVSHTFHAKPEVAKAVHFLLDLGFYMKCVGLLLLNLGIPPEGSNQGYGWTEALQTIALRLGWSVFVVAILHTINVLILSILNRTNQRDAQGT